VAQSEFAHIPVLDARMAPSVIVSADLTSPSSGIESSQIVWPLEPIASIDSSGILFFLELVHRGGKCLTQDNVDLGQLGAGGLILEDHPHNALLDRLVERHLVILLASATPHSYASLVGP
jgi:hypothetical protein